MTARERAQRRWWRFPVDVAFDAPLGELVEDTPLSRHELEWLAGHGPLAPGEEIPPDDEEARVNALSEEECQAELCGTPPPCLRGRLGEAPVQRGPTVRAPSPERNVNPV